MATWFNLWTRRWRNPQGVYVAAQPTLHARTTTTTIWFESNVQVYKLSFE